MCSTLHLLIISKLKITHFVTSSSEFCDGVSVIADAEKDVSCSFLYFLS